MQQVWERVFMVIVCTTAHREMTRNSDDRYIVSTVSGTVPHGVFVTSSCGEYSLCACFCVCVFCAHTYVVVAV